MNKMIEIASNSRLNVYPLGERRRLIAKVDSPPTWRGIRITLDFTLNKPYSALVAGALVITCLGLGESDLKKRRVPAACALMTSRLNGITPFQRSSNCGAVRKRSSHG